MALGDPYVTVAEVKTHLGATVSSWDTYLLALVDAVSTSVENHCGRQFNDNGTATARVYRRTSSYVCHVDDFHTDTGLIVKTDEDDDGTYETTWAVTDYILDPLNGIENGMTGFPCRRLTAVETNLFPCGLRPTVQVTARWGWAAVPGPVKQAALMQCGRVFNRKDSPQGVAGFGDFAVRVVRLDPDVQSMLDDYVHPLKRVMVA